MQQVFMGAISGHFQAMKLKEYLQVGITWSEVSGISPIQLTGTLLKNCQEQNTSGLSFFKDI